MDFQVLIDSEILFGNGIIQELHSWDEVLGGLFWILGFFGHYLGSNIFFMGILSVTYILFSPRLGLGLAWGLLSAGIINSFLKFYFKSPRPFDLDPSIAVLQQSAGELAFGFPSGHVHTAIVIWGLLFWYVKFTPIKIFSLFVIILMPFARMYVGVHFLGDVIGGVIFGILNLIVVILFMNRYPSFPNLDRYDSNPRIARTYILAILALSLLPVLLLDNELAEPEVHSLNTMIVSSASLAGALIGLIILKIGSFKNRLNWGDYRDSTTSPWITLIVRVGVLVLGVLLFYFLPSLVLKNFYWGNDILIRYLRYLLVGFFIVYLIPVILFRIKDGMFIKSNFNG